MEIEIQKLPLDFDVNQVKANMSCFGKVKEITVVKFNKSMTKVNVLVKYETVVKHLFSFIIDDLRENKSCEFLANNGDLYVFVDRSAEKIYTKFCPLNIFNFSFPQKSVNEYES